MVVTVTVKWGKQKFPGVEVDAEAGVEQLRAQLFALTNVPPQKQKLLAKGKQIKADGDLAKVKDKQTLMMMGSAAELAAPPTQPVRFQEDMTEAEKAGLDDAKSAGLHNLGNTCYMNSTLQVMRHIPELSSGVKAHAASKPGQSTSLPVAMGKLLQQMDSTSDPVTPHDFTNIFRQTFPQFAERGEHGHFMQQDADEAYQQILATVKNEVKSDASSQSSSSNNIIDELFAGELEIEEKCLEPGDETVTHKTDQFLKLRCNIDKDVSHVADGVFKGLDGEKEKRSEALGRNAIFKETARVSKLPKYLNVQMVRFYWKKNEAVVGQKACKAKMLRRVVFPIKLDAYQWLSDKLKTQVGTYRKFQLDLEDKQRADSEKIPDSEKAASSSSDAMEVDATSSEPDEKKQKTGKDEKSDELINADDVVCIPGFYDLVGVVCHKGTSSDGGHYVAWARKDVHEEKWQKFDDDVVTPATTDDIKQLFGGAPNWFIGYMLFYKRRDHDGPVTQLQITPPDQES